MANRPPYRVTTAVSQLSDGLTEGNSYRAQHVGGAEVEYCNYATEPDATTDVGWNKIRQYDNIIFEAEAANAVWARTLHGVGSLALSDG